MCGHRGPGAFVDVDERQPDGGKHLRTDGDRGRRHRRRRAERRRGNVRGTLLGAFVIGFLSDGLVIVGVSAYWQMVFMGAVIVVAVLLNGLDYGRRPKKSSTDDERGRQNRSRGQAGRRSCPELGSPAGSGPAEPSR